MASIDFDPADFHYLKKLVLGAVQGAGAPATTTAHMPVATMEFRRLLLASLQVAPNDPTVQRLAQSHLTPITDDTTEFARAVHRVCLILRNDGADATGFLIGPDLVLTAAHTLRGIRGIFADPANVMVCFDRFGSNPASLNAASSCGLRKRHDLPHQPVVVASSIKTDSYGRRQMHDNGLDYILVRLEDEIGKQQLPQVGERGWMDGSSANFAPPNGPDAVTVLQHPRGRPLHYARGNVLNTRDGRIHYKVDVDGGSSGSPILDRYRRIVGIHTGQVSEYERIGISFQAIFDDVMQELKAGGIGESPLTVFPPYPPPFMTENMMEPVPLEDPQPVGA